MKKHFSAVAGMIALALFVTHTAVGQDKEEKDKKKNKDKYEVVKDNYEEVIVKKKTDKDIKVVIEIKGDDVLVNGKPIDDFDNDDISVRKQRIPRMGGNQFRNGVWNQDDFNGAYVYEGGNKALLGVVTDEDKMGARITSVTDGSAAEKAGLKEDDIITKIDDKKVENHETLTKTIGKYKPEDKVTVTYIRDGKENKVTATLGKNKSEVRSFGMLSPNMAPHMQTFPDMNFNFDWNEENGANVFSAHGRPQIGIRAQDTEDDKGAKVLDVREESPAQKAGIHENDIITEFDGKAVKNADDLAEAAHDARENEKSTMTVKFLRDGQSQTAEIKIPKKLKSANL